MRKIKNWLLDKWAWLKTFNNPPTVIVTAEKIVGTARCRVFEVKGRVGLTVHCTGEFISNHIKAEFIVDSIMDDINNDKPVNR